MWRYISEKLLEAIPLEIDPEIGAMMMNSLCKVEGDLVSYLLFFFV